MLTLLNHTGGKEPLEALNQSPAQSKVLRALPSKSWTPTPQMSPLLWDHFVVISSCFTQAEFLMFQPVPAIPGHL